VLITGQYSATAQFGTNNLVAAGSNDIWLARLSSGGAWKWAKTAGGVDDDYGRGVTTTGDGYAISGSFSTNAAFFGTNLTSLGGKDIYVAKFNWADQLLWVRTLGGAGDDEGAEISTDADGGFLIAGSFRNTIRFGYTELTSAGARDYLIARFAANGAPLWMFGPGGGPGDDVSYACAADRSGNFFYSGFFNTNAFFGYSVITNSGAQDCVFGKIPYSAADLPALSIAAAPPNAHLAWPLLAANYVLEQSTNLTRWSSSLVRPTFAGNEKTIDLPALNTNACFFRLRGPE
jgi:hypothetical protein